MKRLFLSCSTDGQVHMYDTLGQRPVMVFEPGSNEYLTSVCWSPYRATVFVTVSNNGNIYIYDLILSKRVPSYVIDYKAPPAHLKQMVSNKTAYSIAFNPVVRDFLAIGYHDGTAKIFQLNYQLSQPKKDEVSTLRGFID